MKRSWVEILNLCHVKSFYMHYDNEFRVNYHKRASFSCFYGTLLNHTTFSHQQAPTSFSHRTRKNGVNTQNKLDWVINIMLIRVL